MKNTGCDVHHFAIYFRDPSLYLLGPNILLNTLFSKTLRLYSFFKARDQFHTHTTQPAK